MRFIRPFDDTAAFDTGHPGYRAQFLSGPETHFEMIVPAPSPGASLLFPVDAVGDVPADRQAASPGYVRKVDFDQLAEPLPGFRVQPLAEPGISEHVVVNYIEVAPGQG